MDIDLAQRRVAGIDKAVRRPRRNDNHIAGLHFALFIAGDAGCASFLDNNDLIVLVSMQLRTAPGRRVNEEKRNVNPMLFANKFVRHPNKRQFFAIDHAQD